MRDFRFTNETSGRNTDATATLLVQPRLWIPGGDYPDHMRWREKALEEIKQGSKRTMLALWGSDPVGQIIYQRHPQDPAIVEIRNISIEPHARGRLIASFLLRQVEAEASIEFPGATTLVGDTKVTNTGLLAFAASHGYSAQLMQQLDSPYAHNGTPDVAFSKTIAPARPTEL